MNQTTQLIAQVDLNTVTFAYHFAGVSTPAQATVQIFLHRVFDDPISGEHVDEWPMALPRLADGSVLTIALYPGVDNTGSFAYAGLPLGTYSEARIILFDAASNFTRVLYDSGEVGIPFTPPFTVATRDSRVTWPRLELRSETILPQSLSSESIGVTGAQVYNWTPDGRGAELQTPDGKSAVAPTWYATNTFDIVLNIADGKPHQVSLYCVDWDRSGRSQRIDALDTSGRVLDSRTVLPAEMEQGVYARFNLTGNVTLRVTLLTPPATTNPVVMALFFDPAGSDLSNDMTTRGKWIGTYGSEGYAFAGSFNQPPSYLKAGLGAVDGKIHIPYIIKFPDGFHVGDGAFWAMAKGDAFFDQQWVQFEGHSGYTAITHRATGPDPYLYCLGEWVFPMPAPGLYNIQFGLFDNSWQKPYTWLWPGLTFESGGEAWVQKCPAEKLPSLSIALDKGKSPFWIGGNFGNDICFNTLLTGIFGADAGYFSLLKFLVPASVMRINYLPDKALSEETYLHQVEQIAHWMLLGGCVPMLAPQIMPSGNTQTEKADKLVRLHETMVKLFAGYPVIHDICNEPSDMGDWAAWRPVAMRVAQAIRAIDPKAIIVCPLEGYSKDARAASANPLPTGLVDFYGWHPYLAAQDLAAYSGTLNNLICQEYYDGGQLFHASLQALAPRVQGVMPWAYTVKDSLPLVASRNGAAMTFSSVGQAIVGFNAQWMKGERLSNVVPDPVPVPNPNPVPTPTPPALTAETVQTMIDTSLGKLTIPTLPQIQSAIDLALGKIAVPSDAHIEALIAADLAKLPPPPPALPPPTTLVADGAFQQLGSPQPWPGVYSIGGSWQGTGYLLTPRSAAENGTPSVGNTLELQQAQTVHQALSGLTPGVSVTLTFEAGYRRGYPGAVVSVGLDGQQIGQATLSTVSQEGYVPYQVAFTPQKAIGVLTLANSSSGIVHLANLRLIGNQASVPAK